VSLVAPAIDDAGEVRAVNGVTLDLDTRTRGAGEMTLHEGEQSSTHDAQQFHQERPPTSVATSPGQCRTDAAEDRAELRSHCVERAAIGVPERQSPSRYPNGQELTNDRWSPMIANR